MPMNRHTLAFLGVWAMLIGASLTAWGIVILSVVTLIGAAQ